MGLDQGPQGPTGVLPETNYIQPEPAIPSKGKTLALLAVGAVAVVGLFGWIIRRGRRIR
jgi:hypothetical protein